MALNAEDMRELREQDELPAALLTGATRILVQKGTEAVKWVSVDELMVYLRTNLPI